MDLLIKDPLVESFAFKMEDELNQFDVKMPDIKKIVAQKLVRAASGCRDNLQLPIALNSQRTSTLLKRFAENKTFELKILRCLKSTFKQEFFNYR